MSQYATLKAAIQAVIKQNGNNEITGDLLQQALLSIINSLGANYQYAGIATQATDPGTPDQNVFYIASTAGTYTNFGGLVLDDGEIAILKYNGAWSKETTGAATAAQLNQLGQDVKQSFWFIGNKSSIESLNVTIQSLLDVIIDFWFIPSDSAAVNFNSDDWFIKLGIVGITGSRTQVDDITGIFIDVYLTNGTDYYDFIINTNIYEPSNIQEITGTTGNGGEIHAIIDLNRLDFSAFPSEATPGFGYLILNQGLDKQYYLVCKKTNSISAFCSQNDKKIPVIANEIEKGNSGVPTSNLIANALTSNFNKWCIGLDANIATLNASAKSLKNVFLDVWFNPSENIKSTFDNQDYYIKFGIVGVGGNTLSSIGELTIFAYLTNGTVEDILFGGGVSFDNPTEIQQIEITNDKGKLFIIIDLNKLDFSAFPSEATPGFGYLILNQGLDSGYLDIQKKTSSEYEFVSQNRSELKNIAVSAELIKFYKLNYYDNILCAGDSVTKGYVVEGTQAHPETIYREMPEKSYPTELGKILPKATITTVARSGITPIEWLQDFFPTLDFTQYDLIILELGLNGDLDINDINTPNTNTYAYRQIVQGMRAQNSEGVIVLVRSSHFVSNIMDVLNAVALESDCIVVDLQSQESKNIVDLDSATMHGYWDNNGNPEIDWAHFTRKGYNAKAYVISRMIEERLSNATKY